MQIKLKDFKRLYLKARKENKVQFQCRGKTFVTKFAKYIIMHAEDNMTLGPEQYLEFTRE